MSCKVPKIVTHGLHSCYSQEIILSHDIKKVYSCINDIPSYPMFIPGIKRARVLSSDIISGNTKESVEAHPTVSFAELQVDVVAVQLRYISRVLSIPYNSVEARCLNSTFFKNLQTTWKFSPVSESKTLVNFHIEFEFKNAIYGTTLYPIFSKMAQVTLKSFESQLNNL